MMMLDPEQTENVPVVKCFDDINWWPGSDFQGKTLGEQYNRIKEMFKQKPYYLGSLLKVNEDILIDMCILLQDYINKYGEDHITNITFEFTI